MKVGAFKTGLASVKSNVVDFAKSKYAKGVVVATGFMTCTLPAFAETVEGGGSGAVSNTFTVNDIANSVTESFKVSDITSVIGKIIGSGIAFYLTWWAARKIFRGVKGAFSKGKLNI